MAQNKYDIFPSTATSSKSKTHIYTTFVRLACTLLGVAVVLHIQTASHWHSDGSL